MDGRSTVDDVEKLMDWLHMLDLDLREPPFIKAWVRFDRARIVECIKRISGIK